MIEFREMVGALHALGYQVVLDQVYNHMAACGQDRLSVWTGWCPATTTGSTPSGR